MSTGDLVREWRTRRGLTQDQLATTIGTGQAAISRIEKGTDVPTLPLLERLASAMGCSVNITFTDNREGKVSADELLDELMVTHADTLEYLKANGD
ncbi:helix-turn-helix domain-containing protein [Streptomyces fractus]|uniref:helix-turn-helix domain-containing protein n=1 Tax=Streptomyces fractus TaxID=641806 RepID=UPI003CF274C2